MIIPTLQKEYNNRDNNIYLTKLNNNNIYHKKYILNILIYIYNVYCYIYNTHTLYNTNIER